MADHAGLGGYLRQCRETRGLSLDDLSQVTRIAPRYLHALEGDGLAVLPAPVFVRRYIRAYCATVAEPATRALRLYETARAAAVPAPPPPVAPPALSRRAALPALIAVAGLLVLGGALYLALSSPAAGSGSGAPEASP
jgi:cytoskeleton protein RodZ